MDTRVGIQMKNGTPSYYGFRNPQQFDTMVTGATPDAVVAQLDSTPVEAPKTHFQPWDCFEELINQGYRDCTVVAVDQKTGRYLYEYTMPNGTSALRRETGRSISYEAVPKFWRDLIESQFGWDNLVNNPQ